MREPIKNLSAECVNFQPRDYDFYGKGYGTDWEIPFEQTDEEMDSEEYIPMMNYIYPLPDNFNSSDDDFKKLVDKMSAVTLVCLIEEESYFLALTGGGMNLSWEICEAYMILGYLPPAHFCRLPAMAGKRLNTRNKWIMAGCRKSLRLQKWWADLELRDLKHTVNSLKGYK